MNKILFKLIEGKGKFFLMRDCPNLPKKLFYGFQDASHGDNNGILKNYSVEHQKCISEALKNGEIVNPELVVKGGTHGLLFTLDGKQIMDGDTFDLPEGMGFEEREWVVGAKFIRLLPEKPVQKEESQEELFDALGKVLHHDLTSNGWDYDKHTAMNLFTIKRKDS